MKILHLEGRSPFEIQVYKNARKTIGLDVAKEEWPRLSYYLSTRVRIDVNHFIFRKLQFNEIE